MRTATRGAWQVIDSVAELKQTCVTSKGTIQDGFGTEEVSKFVCERPVCVVRSLRPTSTIVQPDIMSMEWIAKIKKLTIGEIRRATIGHR